MCNDDIRNYNSKISDLGYLTKVIVTVSLFYFAQSTSADFWLKYYDLIIIYCLYSLCVFQNSDSNYRHEAFRIDGQDSVIMPINSPGGSTMQWGAGQG